ncbi:sulfatase-like hydrolase/transferase [Mesorhizobium sp. CGMCC 1.15528]|uniref:Sulfatase-like hydrolase/transferase n=1 Tax=Mesorhizobium zhangyense TaxID=1776730 RepID=A0A7C9R8C9_9HYPH|nr:sulfatase-like hydrolase/transferase [Mesorhizobium zhangyense]NGN42336.1 sulfatase-like hydrolase/transferase [Mesorhizobium zhangyense]
MKPASLVQGLAMLVLCAAWPVLDFAVANLSDQSFQPAKLIVYFGALLAMGVVVSLLAKLVRPRWNLGTVFSAAGGGLAVLFNYNLIARTVEVLPTKFNGEVLSLIAFVIFFLAAVTLVTFLSRKGSIIAAVVFGLGIMTAHNGFVVGKHLFFSEAGRASLASSTAKTRNWPSDVSRLSVNRHYKGSAAERPANVYFIIPDMFMSENEYVRMTGKPYEMDDYLRNQGFKVLDNHYSNAPVTRFSLAHVFGQKYFVEEGGKPKITAEMQKFLPWRINNDVTAEFRKRGYNIFNYIDAYVNPECDKLADFCFSKASFIGNQDLVFLERAPFFDLVLLSGSDKLAIWRRLLTYSGRYEIPEILASLPKKGASPHFTYIHSGLPHSPYRFTADCTYYDAYPPIRKNKYEGSVRAYANQVDCASKLYPQLIDAILKEDPDAMIVFQADHGVNYRGQETGANIKALTDDMVAQNLSAISAYRLPERCQQSLGPDMSPVNTFRVVFACLDNREPELLPARHFLMYYLGWQPSGMIREVTDIINKRKLAD